MTGPSSGPETTGHRVVMLYHPSHHVPDLAEAEEFFARVFGRSSTRLSTLSASEPPDGWSNDYATFTPIADLLFDSIDPRRYQVAGRHPYEPVATPELKGLGWYVEGIDLLYRAMRERGFTLLDQLGRPAEGDDPPRAAGAPMPLFFTTPSDTGLRHELLPPIPFPLDHRLATDWKPGQVDPDDPLGIVRCTHHTIRTDHLDRALTALVDVMGGVVVHRGPDDLLGVDAVHVRLADTDLQLAGPGPGEPPVGEVDAHNSIAFEVVDLDRAAAHLTAHGVEMTARTDHALLTDPTTTLGIAWRLLRAS